MVGLQLFSNLEYKLTAASQNLRQCLLQEITKILTEWMKCIFLCTGPEMGEVWEEQVVVILLDPPSHYSGLGWWGNDQGMSVTLAPSITFVKQEQRVLDREVQVAWELDSLMGAPASWLSFPSPRGGASLGCRCTKPIFFSNGLHLFLVAPQRPSP